MAFRPLISPEKSNGNQIIQQHQSVALVRTGPHCELGCGLLFGGIMPPPVKMPIRAVRAALIWFRKTTALDGKAGIGAGAAIDPVAPIPDVRRASGTGETRPLAVARQRELIVTIDNLWWPVPVRV